MAESHSDPLGETAAMGSGSGRPRTEPRAGQVLGGRYRVIEKIGRGGMGAIYEAEQVTTGKRVAVKTLLPGLGKVEEIARRFEREARATSVLNHPAIVSVIDFGAVDDGSLYLVMELLRGRPLGDLIDEGGVARDRALVIVRQVLEALAYAHEHGVIHRDLKPDNVMVLDAGDLDEAGDRVKLFDFGIAKVVGDAERQVGGDKLTQAGIAFGTPDYMAPEQALGETVDARADVYSVGVILFELVAGRKPFVSDDKLAVLRMQVALDPPPLSQVAPGVSPALDAVVRRALAKRREERFASATEMLAALDASFEDRTPTPVLAAPAPAPVPVPVAAPVPVPVPVPVPAGAITAVPTPPSGPVALLTQRSVLIAAGAIVVLLIILVIAASAGDDRPGSHAPSAGALPGKSERARAGEKKLAAGDAAGAVDLLERRLADPGGERDAWAYLVLGHARAKLGRDIEAITAYERATALAPELAYDRTLRQAAIAMLDKKDKSVALGALDLIGRLGDAGYATIVQQASHGKVREVRRRARELAEKLDLFGEVDLLSSYTLDLAQGASCRERKEAVPRLRALRDKKAIPALKKARDRSGGFLGLEDVNDCLDRDAKEAIEFLEALP